MDIQETTFKEWKEFIGITMTPKGYLYKGKFYNVIELYDIYLSESMTDDEAMKKMNEIYNIGK